LLVVLVFIKAYNIHFYKTSILASISKNPGLAMLLVDSFSELVILHNLDCLPANLFRSEDKLVALNRVGSKADCYQIDPISAFQDLEFATPLWHDMKNATMEESVQNLQPQDQSSATFKGKQVMIVPPLVSVTMLETKSLLPSTLIPALSTKFQEFDHLSPTVKACTIFKPVLEYLWAIHHKKNPSTMLGID